MSDRIDRRKRRLSATSAAGFLALAVNLLPAHAAAQFYIGPSYLSIPGLASGEAHKVYKDWIRAEARYWGDTPELPEIRGVTALKNDLLFTGPVAPTAGPGVLAFAVDKNSPALGPLMETCRAGAELPAVKFAESAELQRHPQEYGPLPADVPKYFEYALKAVRLSCPVVAKAPEQAFRAQFAQIEWLNYRPQAKLRPITAQPARLAPAKVSGKTLVYAVTWFAAAVDGRQDQCPRMNAKPSQDDFYALMPKPAADAARARFAKEGGVDAKHIPLRGPDQMNVGLMPGIVPDPGHVAPVSDVVQGLDLDHDDGVDAPPKGVRKHKNFVSPDGRRGVDNQLFTVEGCVEGFRRKGFLPMIFNEGRAAGRPTALIEVSGVDDDRNDPDVTITVFYSSDDLRRSPQKAYLPDYTFRVSDSPEYTQSFARFRGRIIDGVVVTEPIDKIHIHETTGIEATIYGPRLRIELLPDGRMKAVLGGYLDWRQRLLWEIFRTGDYENTIGFQVPAIYNAMKRAADGLQDKDTGEFNGISAAFEIEGVSAFVPPMQQKTLVAEDGHRPRRDR